MGRLSNQKSWNYRHKSLGLVKPSELGAPLYIYIPTNMISNMKLKVQNSKQNLIQDVLIVHVVRKYILYTVYIVADAKDNEREENREERNEGCQKN